MIFAWLSSLCFDDGNACFQDPHIVRFATVMRSLMLEPDLSPRMKDLSPSLWDVRPSGDSENTAGPGGVPSAGAGPTGTQASSMHERGKPQGAPVLLPRCPPAQDDALKGYPRPAKLPGEEAAAARHREFSLRPVLFLSPPLPFPSCGSQEPSLIHVLVQ